MKAAREPIAWFLIIIWSLTGFLIYIYKSPPGTTGQATQVAESSHAIPAFFATVGLAAFLLLSRFLTSSGSPPPPGRFRHISVACLLATGGMLSWEFSQMFLLGRTFSFSFLTGVLAGPLMIVCCWFLLKMSPLWFKRK